MADRLTDKFTKAFAAAAHAISVYTRANQGLPMIMVKADSIPAVTTQTLTITATTDVWVNGIETNITSAAFALIATARVTRIQVAGFLLFEDQGSNEPFFFDTSGGRAGYQNASQWKGFATPFQIRQGDIISVTCENNTAAAVAILSVKVDAYRTSHNQPG
jgi:hypothetical protein